MFPFDDKFVKQKFNSYEKNCAHLGLTLKPRKLPSLQVCIFLIPELSPRQFSTTLRRVTVMSSRLSFGDKNWCPSVPAAIKFNPSLSFMVNFDPLLFKNSSSPEKGGEEKIGKAVWRRAWRLCLLISILSASAMAGLRIIWFVMAINPYQRWIRSTTFNTAIHLVCGWQRWPYRRGHQILSRHILKTRKWVTSIVTVQIKNGQGRKRMFADFMLENCWFTTMDSAREHNFNFNEAVSFIVHCNTQRNWLLLGKTFGNSRTYGWLKDRYGLSWQIVPVEMDQMMNDKDPERIARVMQAFLQMKKFDLAESERVYEVLNTEYPYFVKLKSLVLHSTRDVGNGPT